MTGRWSFSFKRFVAMALKEFVQMRRDRMTFIFMVGVPVMQMILFGFAINTNPKDLPAALLCQDSSPFARSVVAAFENSSYFRFAARPASEAEAERAMKSGEVLFVVQIPQDFAASSCAGRSRRSWWRPTPATRSPSPTRSPPPRAS
jgi:ABC-2 type transport system permease protein